MNKWVTIGGDGYMPVGQPTGSYLITFYYSDDPNPYVRVQSNGMLNFLVTPKDGSVCHIVMKAHEKMHLRKDIARALWEEVVAKGWNMLSTGEVKDAVAV